MEPGITGFGQYDALRRMLNLLREEFGDTDDLRLFHQVIAPLDGPFSQQQWKDFISANTFNIPEAEWQTWLVRPGGEECSRFYGDELGFSTFEKMAERGMAILTSLRSLTASGTVVLPSGFVLKSSACTGMLGWIELLYETARCYSTLVLRARPAFWNRTGQFAGEDGNPAHPFYEQLRHDLFRSSAEAIGLWLDPEQDTEMGEKITEAPILLPPEPLQNGPYPPDQFWLSGIQYDGFSLKPWHLLDYLWGKENVTLAEASQHLYGDEEQERAVISAQKSLNRQLFDMECPAQVRRKHERLWLVFNQD